MIQLVISMTLVVVALSDGDNYHFCSLSLPLLPTLALLVPLREPEPVRAVKFAFRVGVRGSQGQPSAARCDLKFAFICC